MNKEKTIERIRTNVGMLRQWINERPAGSKLITNEDIEHWLELTSLFQELQKDSLSEMIGKVYKILDKHNHLPDEITPTQLLMCIKTDLEEEGLSNLLKALKVGDKE